MPFTTPVRSLAVKNQKEDVPGYMEGKQYGLFSMVKGLSYQ